MQIAKCALFVAESDADDWVWLGADVVARGRDEAISD